MRVLTLNLWGTRGDWNGRRGVLRRGLEMPEPDLVAFQETVLTDAYDQARDLLGATFHITHQRDRERDGQGLSIASRWPPTRTHDVDLVADLSVPA